MAKLVVEENLKSKHPDSFKALKSYGYKFIGHGNEDGKEHQEVYRNRNTGHVVAVKDSGTWSLGHSDHRVMHVGKSHSDLSVILKKVHD